MPDHINIHLHIICIICQLLYLCDCLDHFCIGIGWTHRYIQLIFTILQVHVESQLIIILGIVCFLLNNIDYSDNSGSLVAYVLSECTPGVLL